MRNSRQAGAEQARPDEAGGRWVKAVGAAILLAAGACASEARQPWPVYEGPPEGRLELGLHLPSDLEVGATVPQPSAYPGPGPKGARPWLTATSDPRASARLSALAEARAGGRELLGSLEADVDGDGRRELVTLSRGAGGAHVLEVYAPAGDRALSSRRIAPRVHLGRRCHLEVRLLGALRTAEGERPLLWRDRGVGCARFEGGGFQRHLLVEFPSREALVELPLAEARHVEKGASDGYASAIWKLASESGEALFVRGIAWARRACDHPDAGFWVEELAYRRLEVDGSLSAYRAGRTLPLPSHTLPPELLRSHMAPCRASARPDHRRGR